MFDVSFNPTFPDFEKQLAFATAAALTATAKEAQGAIVSAYEDAFTIRTNWLNPSAPTGIKITPATKANHEAHVHTEADWLPIHEFGGLKVSRSGGDLAVPTDAVKRTGRRIITRAQRPRNIPGAFVLRTKHGPVLAVRVKGQIQILYGLEDEANIEPAPIFYPTAERIVSARYETILDEKLAEALRTAT